MAKNENLATSRMERHCRGRVASPKRAMRKPLITNKGIIGRAVTIPRT
jgi:hypothetical protein